MSDQLGIIDVTGHSLQELRETVQNDQLQRVLSRLANAEAGQSLGFTAVVD
ncbi:MAG TPA: hypothetical protein VIR33_11525 [Thermopolyspora sp.]|jgi:hypothetical protein